MNMTYPLGINDLTIMKTLHKFQQIDSVIATRVSGLEKATIAKALLQV